MYFNISNYLPDELTNNLSSIVLNVILSHIFIVDGSVWSSAPAIYHNFMIGAIPAVYYHY